MSMEFQDLLQRAREVRAAYAIHEQAAYGRQWKREDIAAGFVGDVGDLMKLVLAHQGIRNIPDAHARLGHELADCLWSVLVLADMYDIDIEQAFFTTMDELERHLYDLQNLSA